MAVLASDLELMQALDLTSKDIREWKRQLAMRPLYEEPVLSMRRSLRKIDWSFRLLKRQNNVEAVRSTIRARRTCHRIVKQLEWPLWRCKNALRLLARKLGTGIPAYAQSSCRKLTTRLTLLSQELRGMVHTHLLDEKVLHWMHYQVEHEIMGHRIFGLYQYCSHDKPGHWRFVSTRNIRPGIIPDTCERAAETISRDCPGYSIDHKEFDKFATGQSLYFRLPLSAFSSNVTLQLNPKDLIHHGFHRYQMKKEDWAASRLCLRKLLVDVTKPVEEKRGIVVIQAQRVIHYQSHRCYFEVWRYLTIVHKIARELRNMNLERVEVFLEERND